MDNEKCRECRLCHVAADLLHANSVAVAQETAEDSFKKHGATVLCQNEQNFMPLGFWLKVVVFGVRCVLFFLCFAIICLYGLEVI